MTETLTDTITTGRRAALVAYYELRRTQAQVRAAHAQIEAEQMDVMGRTVRMLSDAAVLDEYQRILGRS